MATPSPSSHPPLSLHSVKLSSLPLLFPIHIHRLIISYPFLSSHTRSQIPLISKKSHQIPCRRIVEAKKWTTRRNNNPRLSLDSSTSPTSADSDHLLNISATSPSYDGSRRKPFLSPTTVVAAWYTSNIGVLLLKKYLLNIYGFRCPIFLTTLHMLSCVAYSFVEMHWLSLVQHQPIHSRLQLLKILSLSTICYIPRLFGFLICVASTAGRALKYVVQRSLILMFESKKFDLVVGIREATRW